MVDVRDHSEARGTPYIVAIMLAERAPDETRVARPGLKLLAQDARVDRRTCQRALRQLEELGEIEVVGFEDGGRGKATEFKIVVGEKGRQSDAPLDPQRAASDPEKGGNPSRKGGASDAPTEENLTTEPNTEGAHEAELKFCRWLSGQADEELRRSYPAPQLEAAAWLLEHVDRAELRDAVGWAHTRTYWASRVRTAGKLRRAWPDLRAEWRAATKGSGFGKRAASHPTRDSTDPYDARVRSG